MLHLSLNGSASQAIGNGELNSKVQSWKHFWKAGDYEVSSSDELVMEEANEVDDGDGIVDAYIFFFLDIIVDAYMSICKIVKEYKGNLGKNW